MKTLEYLKLSIITDVGEGPCVEWPYGRHLHGYGQCWDGSRNIRAHILAYALANHLTPPLGFVIRHSCDNPCCIRVAHLIQGTQAENVRDAINRKRFLPKGEGHNLSKLKNEQVLQIRSEYERREGGKVETRRKLAKMFEVSPSCIQSIVQRITWQHI